MLKVFRHARNEKGEDMVDIVVSVASFPKHIVLDGTVYVERKTPYRVTKGKAAVLRELMARGWEEEERRLGTSEGNAKHRLRQYKLSSQGLQQVA